MPVISVRVARICVYLDKKPITAITLLRRGYGKRSDYWRVIVKLNRLGDPLRGSTPLIDCPHTDGVGPDGVVTIFLVLVIPLQVDSIAVRVRASGVERRIVAAVDHIPGGLSSKGINAGGGIGHRDIRKRCVRVACIVNRGCRNRIGPCLIQSQSPCRTSQQSGIAIQLNRLIAELHAPLDIQSTAAGQAHIKRIANMNSSGGINCQVSLVDDLDSPLCH